MLKSLDYVYPYHQAIGFYLDNTGQFLRSDLDQLRELGINFKFYLCNQLENSNYSSKWQVYYPNNLH